MRHELDNELGKDPASVGFAPPCDREGLGALRDSAVAERSPAGSSEPIRGGPAHLEDRIASLARRQHGLVTRAQLLELGVSASKIQRRIDDRRLALLHRGVYQLGPLGADHHREMSAVLACGPRAVLSHISAAGLWRIVSPPHIKAPVHVTRVGAKSSRKGVRVHRVSSLPDDEVTSWRGIPITTPMRTLVDLASQLGPHDLEQALAHAERRRLASAAEVLALLERAPHRPGASLLRRILDGGASLTRSNAEERLRALLDRAHLPAPRRNARVVGHEVDAVWMDERIVLEVDGFAFHKSRESFEEDRRRDAELVAAGFAVQRVTWRQLVKEPEAVVARLAAALALSRAGR